MKLLPLINDDFWGDQDPGMLFRMADEEKVTHFGTSAKFIDSINKMNFRPNELSDFPAMRSVLSTGSVLSPESFDWVYDSFKGDVTLASITGGTDILSCFALGQPDAPVRRGELQCAGLGMATEVYGDDCKPVAEGEQGELVCTLSFPSAPTGFLNDEDGAKYRSAYFEACPGIWTHGDFISKMPSGGFVVYGRSDSTLNPGGVRIGTAEIYRQVEQLDWIIESIAVGQELPDGDTRIVLFVVLREGTLDDEKVAAIKSHIRTNTTPRHVPAVVAQVEDIPRTKSGKITEVAVREVIHSRPIKNQDALANPETLEFFVGRAFLIHK